MAADEGTLQSSLYSRDGLPTPLAENCPEYWRRKYRFINDL
jgi:hypothetical protein